MHARRILFILMACLAVTTFAEAQDSVADRFTIKLGSYESQPDADGSLAVTQTDRVFVLQFHTLPDEQRRAELATRGFRFVRYIGGNAWLIQKNAMDADPSALSNVRAALPFTPEMKRSRIFSEDADLAGKLKDNRNVALSVRFLPGVQKQQALELLQSHDLHADPRLFQSLRVMQVQTSAEGLEALLSADQIEFIEPALPGKKLYNILAAARAQVGAVQNRRVFRNADGSGVRVGVWDGGEIFEHDDFGNRVTLGEEGSTSSHATHVAGTIAGSGLGDVRALGMAPEALLYSYDFRGDEVGEMSSAIDRFEIMISNNSWGSVGGWDTRIEDNAPLYEWWGSQWIFGFYANETAGLDTLARDRDLLIVFAAGNGRGSFQLGEHVHGRSNTRFFDFHPANPGYGSVSPRSSGKNVISAGATMKDDVMTSFSGWGPTDDGRIKPDIVANGYQLYSTRPNNSYGDSSGTSMATPGISGAAALLADYYQRRHNESISTDMLKNLLLHSARDLGAAGPDYVYGFGHVDVEHAARIIRQAGMNPDEFPSETGKRRDRDEQVESLMITGSITDGKKDRYRLVLPEGFSEMRVTLYWHDVAGERLVNDLDSWVRIRGQGRYRAYVLDPANPAAPATTGQNTIDNVEHIVITNPRGGKAKVVVRGTHIPEGPQRYTLIISLTEGNTPVITGTDGAFRIESLFPSTSADFDNLNPTFELNNGDQFFFYIRFFVDENTNYGDYDGSVTSFWRVLDETGQEVFVTWMVSANLTARDLWWRWRLGPYDLTDDNLRPGSYTLETTLLFHNGETETASVGFTVN